MGLFGVPWFRSSRTGSVVLKRSIQFLCLLEIHDCEEKGGQCNIARRVKIDTRTRTISAHNVDCIHGDCCF